ncbi:hypothetical protein GOBAR_AA07637 [Gossypium barbadense]|uniref:Uncharacterized protein n=1 Tax=Gossypium barbadense TaxID=3634 RepID=A0A2P5YBQ0_GOSBA|nr:hypothetical protein GOBAR_AA07637 [Gossypium barbadense]
MLRKFILVSETRFQNTETALKNQQASIQGLETQIGQLAKLISERPQGSLPSNTESNPREQLNAITVRDKEGLVEPEPEPRQKIVVSKGKGEVDHNEQKSKPRTQDKPKSHHDRLNVSPNQLKVGDKVLLDATDPRITTSEPNRTILFTVLNIFPYGTIEVTHSKFGIFKVFSNLHGQAHRRALGSAHTTGRVIRPCEKRAKFFPKHGIRHVATAVRHGRGQSCQINTGVGLQIKTDSPSSILDLLKKIQNSQNNFE